MNLREPSQFSHRALASPLVLFSARVLLAIALYATGLAPGTARDPSAPTEEQLLQAEYSVSDPVLRERDEILALLAYSVVYFDWQSEDVPRDQRRGYNIGAILVDPDGIPVYYARNSITADQNSTRHAEVRAMTEYLNAHRNFDFKGYTIYTTLEPCVMCAGMMIMTSVSRLVYGQSDVDFSGAFGRLAIDSTSLGGYPPYPRTVVTDPAPVAVRTELDKAYVQFRARSDEKMLARFLTTPEAKALFGKATDALASFEVKHPENAPVLEASLRMLRQMSATPPSQ